MAGEVFVWCSVRLVEWHHFVRIEAVGTSDAEGSADGIAEFGNSVLAGVAGDLDAGEDEVTWGVGYGGSVGVVAVSVCLAAVFDDALEDVDGFINKGVGATNVV